MKYIIMPNHVHIIIKIMNQKGTVPRAPTEKFGIPTKKSIPTILRYLKGGVTRKFNNKHKCNVKIWQRNYYEHIIRNRNEYEKMCKYIENNPKNWLIKANKIIK